MAYFNGNITLQADTLANFANTMVIIFIQFRPNINDKEAPEQHFPKCQSSNHMNANSKIQINSYDYYNINKSMNDDLLVDIS